MTHMAQVRNIAAGFALISITLSIKALAATSVQKPAAIVEYPQRAPMLAATHAGHRVIAVGDHGLILLSDDNGHAFRQARAVPTQALLDSVFFVDARLGWAAGHDGVILHSNDGGETWTLQHEDIDGDHPLFAIRFLDAQRGFAVGLFGVAARTEDGGQTWHRFRLQAEGDEDHHLYSIFGGDNGALFVAAEAGLIYRSGDAGITWRSIQTGNVGSFWTGVHLADSSLLVAGQSGHVFRSSDGGTSWTEIESGTRQSLTDIEVRADGTVLITGLAGVTLTSHDSGLHFELEQRSDRAPLTTAIVADDRVILFGNEGVIDDLR